MTPRPLTLAYHAVSSTWPSDLAVTESALTRQLAFLRQRGFAGLTVSEAERRRRDGTLPARTAVITFDDGYASTLRALPLLAEYGYPATVFVVTRFAATGEPLSWPGIDQWAGGPWHLEVAPLAWNDLETLADAGWEIGSHTSTHPLLTRVDEQTLQDELAVSRSTIAERFGGCTSLAYPYGLADARVANAAGRTGYHVACTLTFVQLGDEPLRRPRIGLVSADVGTRLRLKLAPPALAVRRTAAARAARRLRRRRRWLPQ
jgi:peptidoglycan/xylan/chitin deacetylase (PgdA/CDA1 family)